MMHPRAYRQVSAFPSLSASATPLPMADLTPVIETMEHRWMRAWVNGDMRVLKAITAKNFILLTAS